MEDKSKNASDNITRSLTQMADMLQALEIKNADSSVLQTFSLTTPYAIVLETCRQSDSLCELYEITTEHHTAITLNPQEQSLISTRSMHQHSFVEIMYVLHGEVDMHIEHQVVHYVQGQCCVMNRNIRHSEILSGDFVVVFFMLQDEFLESILKTHYIEHANFGVDTLYRHSNIILQLIRDNQANTCFYERTYITCSPAVSSDRVLTKATDLFNQIILETIEKQFGYSFYVKGAFSRLFQLLTAEEVYTTEKVLSRTGRQDTIFSEITHLLEEKRGHCSREELSRELHYTGEYINKIIKLYTGKTLSEYRQIILLERAKSLLVYSDMSITEIIQELGYANRSYFYRVFKKTYGVTPVEYRNAIQERQI